MASTLPTPSPCCTPCEEPTSVAVPGSAGSDGSNGAAGSNGVDAFTTVSTAFVMPAELANVTVTVADSTWMTSTQIVYVQNCGYMEVQSKPNSTSVILKNLEDTASSLYTENVAPTTAVADANYISPAGIQGPAGTDGASGAPDSASYWTRVAEAGLSGESALSTLSDGVIKHATGVPALADLCTAIETLAANGLITRTAATTAAARTITGTASEISVADGDGVAGNPTLSLDAGVYRSGGTDVALADGGTGASTAAAARANLGNILPGYGLLGEALSVDADTAGDNSITIEGSRYIVDKVTIENASISLTTATGGVFTGTGGGGTTIVSDAALSTLTASTKFQNMTLAASPSTDVFTGGTIYFRIGTPQGAAATLDVRIYGYRLT